MRIERHSSSRFPSLALGGFLLLSGCASVHHHRPRAAATPPGPRRVGTVALVNEELHFVLVDVGSLYIPQPGSALKSFSGDTESAILAVDPEKRRPFIVADIVKGDPKVGDEVRE